MPAAGDFVLAADFPETRGASSSVDELGFTNTAYGQGSTVVGIDFVAPTSGRVMVHWSAQFEPNTANRVRVGTAVYTGGVVGSGTVVSAASDDDSLISADVAGQDSGIGRARLVSGLTPGDTYNAVIEFRMDAAGNGDVFARKITVVSVP